MLKKEESREEDDEDEGSNNNAEEYDPMEAEDADDYDDDGESLITNLSVAPARLWCYRSLFLKC